MITLTVWGAPEDRELLQEMCEDFAEERRDRRYAFAFDSIDPQQAHTEVLKEISAAGDIFFFNSDNIAALVDAGALYRLTEGCDRIIRDNTEHSVAAASVGSELYAYPCEAETYFLYYDRSKYTEQEVKNLSIMMEKDIPDTPINFAVDLNDGWYQAAFFLGAGCELSDEEDATALRCGFNSERGYLAGEYLMQLSADPKFGGGYDDAMIRAGFADGTIAAAAAGAESADEIRSSLGEDYAAVKLPEVTLTKGETVQLISTASYKLIGVNAHTEHPVDAMALAEWLSSYEGQEERLDEFGYAPTNKRLAADRDELDDHKAAQAIIEQLKYSVLRPSTERSIGFIAAAEEFAQALTSGEITKDSLQEHLDAYAEAAQNDQRSRSMQ